MARCLNVVKINDKNWGRFWSSKAMIYLCYVTVLYRELRGEEVN